MKKFLLLCSALIVGFAQSIASDELTFHKGTIVKGKVIVNEPSFIRFIYDGETTETVIGKVALLQIKFDSGRIEHCTDKVDIYDNPAKRRDSKAYEAINVFRDKEDVIGLVRIKEISAKSGGEFALSDKEGRYTKKTIEKLQKEAFKLGGCAILITSEKGNSASLFKNPHSSMTAVVYKY